MVSLKEAKKEIKRYVPGCSIQKYIEYHEMYIFQVKTSDPYEGDFDGFYSVDMETGECRDFAYLNLDVFSEIMSLFEKQPIKRTEDTL